MINICAEYGASWDINFNSTTSSSGDEIANVNCFTTTSDTYYKVQ